MQVLVYPVTDQAADTDSLRRFAQGYLLTRELLRWYQGNYLRDERDRADWRASPLRAKDHSRLAPAYVVTAGFDPLRDEGKAYAERLTQAGVDVTYECFEGQIHGFLPMAGRIAAAHHAHTASARCCACASERFRSCGPDRRKIAESSYAGSAQENFRRARGGACRLPARLPRHLRHEDHRRERHRGESGGRERPSVHLGHALHQGGAVSGAHLQQ